MPDVTNVSPCTRCLHQPLITACCDDCIRDRWDEAQDDISQLKEELRTERFAYRDLLLRYNVLAAQIDELRTRQYAAQGVA